MLIEDERLAALAGGAQWFPSNDSDSGLCEAWFFSAAAKLCVA
jgi:hypothetical protein